MSVIDPNTGKEMITEFHLWATGFRLPNANGRQIVFKGTFAEAWQEMKRLYEEAGSPPYSNVIADYYCGSQMRYPAR